MRTLTYWICPCLDDSPAYSIVSRSKRGAVEALEKIVAACSPDDSGFGQPEKRVIHYKDVFDLFTQVTGEGGGRGYGELIEPQTRGPGKPKQKGSK